MSPYNKAGESQAHPLTLLDAIRTTESRAVLRDPLGNELIDKRLKLDQRNDHSRHLTQWEQTNTLDC